MINPQMLLQMLPVLQGNPAGMLMNGGFNVPQDQMNDPRGIIQHLMDTNQIDQNVYNNAIKMAQNMGYKL